MLYRILFLLIVLAYCLYYAPFGINETDGGFLTALAWQLENGKTLYRDVVYMRPPLPVWWRYLELQLLPDHWAVLGERILFYLKVALYSWLGAGVLTTGRQREALALAGFVVSAHCYPPAAWHTVDGILWAVAAVWLLLQKRGWADILGGAALAAALLCKQSFYPLIFLLPVLLYKSPVQRWLASGLGFTGVLATVGAVLIYQGAWTDFWQQTAGATSAGQFFQHGVLDYFRLHPLVVLPAGILLLPVAHRLWGRRQDSHSKIPLYFWIAAMAWLAGAYIWAICVRQEFTLPFAQIRFLFWLTAGHLLLEWGRGNVRWNELRPALSLLLISWSAALSWGYNLPVLFALPLVWTAFQVSNRLWSGAFGQRDMTYAQAFIQLSILVGLLSMFRYSYEFVYRDGKRSEMTAALGEVFPRLGGIYTSPEHKELYKELHILSKRYPEFKTLPAFPLSSYLCGVPPPLPLDWVVEREMGDAKGKVTEIVARRPPVWLVEKAYAGRLSEDAQLIFTQEIYKNGRTLEETPHFWVISSGE